MSISPSAEIEWRAYREAGHAVMSFLIRNGLDDNGAQTVDRSLALPPFEQVAIEGQSADWSKLTSSLGSLIYASEVLLAGDVAEQIHYPLGDSQASVKTKNRNQALHLLASYHEEYGYDGDYAGRDRAAAATCEDLIQRVRLDLKATWSSVEALAQAVVQQKAIREQAAFVIIREALPPEAKARLDERDYRRANPTPRDIKETYQEAGDKVMAFLIHHDLAENGAKIAQQLGTAYRGPNWRPVPTPSEDHIRKYFMLFAEMRLAGDAAERIRTPVDDGRAVSDSVIRGKAVGDLDRYLEACGWDNRSGERRRMADEICDQLIPPVTQDIQANWACVEALAQAMLEQKKLGKTIRSDAADEVIGGMLSPENKVKLAAFNSRKQKATTPPKKATIVNPTPKPKKPWWKLWE